MSRHELLTKDDVPLSNLMQSAFGTVDAFNDAEHLFLSLLATEVDEDKFTSVAGNMKWDELAELEPSQNGGDLDESVMAIRVKEYGKSLALSPAYIEDSTEQSVLQRIEKMLQGALERENEVVFDALKAGVADGSGVWYDIPDYGNYTFTDTHNHSFAATGDLFGDAAAYSATAHVRQANMDIRHHGKRPGVVLCSSEYAMNFVDELAYDAGYHIPDASGLRSEDLATATMKIDGASIIQTPYLTGNKFYVISDEAPVYFHTKRPVTISQDSQGTPVRDPADLIGSYGTSRYGARLADPLAVVEVTADNLV